MEENNKRIVRNTFFLYGRMIVVLFISLFITRVILRNLGVTDYGVYNVVAGFVSMFAFLNTSLLNAIQRFYNIEKGTGSVTDINEVYSTAILIQSLLAFFLLVVLEAFGTWYINNVMVLPDNRLEATNWVFQFSVFSLIFVVLQIPYSSAIVSYERMDYFAAVSIFDVVLRLIIVLLLPLFKTDRLILFGFLMFILSVINYFLYVFYVKKRISILKFQYKLFKDRFKMMLTFSGWTVCETIAYTFQGQGLNMLMNSFFGTVVNASRGIAFQIQSAVYSFSLNIGTAFKPQLTESYAKKDYIRTSFLFYTMTKVCFFMQFILSVPIFFEIDGILYLWLGSNIPQYTVSFTILVLINTIIGSINMPMSQVILASGRIKTYQVMRSALVFSTLPLSYILLKISPFPELVFYSTIGITILMQPLSLYLLSNVYNLCIRNYLKNVIMPIIFFSIFQLFVPYIVTVIFDASLYRIILSIIVDGLSAVIFGYFILLSKDERLLAKNFVFLKIKK